MLEVLEFIFKDIWHFLGTAVLLFIISQFSFVRIYNHVDNDTKENKDKTEKKDENKQ